MRLETEIKCRTRLDTGCPKIWYKDRGPFFCTNTNTIIDKSDVRKEAFVWYFCNSICYLREYKIEERNYYCKQNKWIKYNIKHWYYFWNGKDNRKRERERKNIRRNHLVLEGRGRGHILGRGFWGGLLQGKWLG